ncbi:innexin unc-9-like [Convolutriloba macropyga]|uniref:innexin unc-9-like n=1 Tax=Convolutriloba macropyga TaxID=536237 RepID=UPI003F525A08
MVLGEVTSLIKQGGSTRSTDMVDKLNFTVTPFIFILFATFTTMRMFVGDTIKCWTENDFTLQKNQYTDNMCWVSNTYYLPQRTMPYQGKMDGTDEEIVYYQWTAIILISLAVTWYLIALCWRFFISRHMDLETILKYAESTRINIDPATRHKFVNDTLSKHFKIYIQRNRNSYSISLAYMAVKIACLVLPILQITFLSTLFGEGYIWYGIDIIQRNMHWHIAEIKPVRFPIVAWCDFFRIVPGNLQLYSIHCVLAANLFNRAIFGIVWFWLIFTFFVTFINWLIWIFRLFAKFFTRRYANTRQNYLRELLIIANDVREGK